MFKLSDYTEYIEENIDQVELPEGPVNLYDPLRYFLTIGGKRIRPILTLLGAELFGAQKEKALYQALAVEVFHNFTLVHDDIMDDAPLRRNKTTVHEKWNNNTGILSGDVMVIKAYQLLCKNIDPKILPETLNLFNSTAIQVCEGQQHDMDFEQRDDVTIHEYIKMISQKTSVLLGSALRTGAIIAGASESDKDAIYDFGLHIGLAFQIKDDILDLYADPEKFGKQVGGDVMANKKTILHLTAINKATKEQLEIVKQLQYESNIDLKISRTRQLFDHLKTKEDCQERMNSHYKLAKEAIDKISVSTENKAALLSLASYLMEREV
ncbi:MAG: polyprenyl synthetase family protein [Crocinitomicaceae bacterium]